MARIEAEYARAQQAFSAPSLSLLSRTWAPVIVSLFATLFDRDRGTIAEDELRAQLPAQLAALKATGVPVPDDTPVTLLRQWVNQNFLERRANPDTGSWEYVLTSHTQDVLEFVTRNSGTRTMLGQSKLRTLAEILRRAALHASSDRDAVVARYDADIARLTSERNRVASGQEKVAVDEYALVEEALQAIATVRSLPADFARVQEAFRRMTRDLQEAFLADSRPHGEVVAEYMRACDALAESSAEGRAFSGAIELLRDEALLSGVQDDIDTVLAALAGAFDTGESQTLAQAVPAVRAGLSHVLRQRAVATAALKQGIETYDAIAERQLADALREAHLALMEVASGSLNCKLPGPAAPQRAVVPTLARTVRMEFQGAGLAPLQASQSQDTSATSFEDLRAYGGPRLPEMAVRLANASAAGSMTASEVFDNLPEQLRRPVEIVGLVQLASSPGWDVNAHIVDGDESSYATIRPDGVRVTYSAPRIDLATDDTRAEHRPPGRSAADNVDGVAKEGEADE